MSNRKQKAETTTEAAIVGNTVLPAVAVGWVCNSCNSLEYTLSVSEDDIQQLGCGSCGGDEFHVGNGR
jgi:hypothetical protein